MNIKLCALLCAALLAADMVFFLIYLHSLKMKRSGEGAAADSEEAVDLRRKEPLHRELSGEKNIQGENWDSFLPTDLIKLLKRKSYSELKVGDQQYISSVIMSVNTADFSEFVHKKSPEETFSYINCLMGRLIPIVYESGGMVEGFEGGGFTALYRNEEKRAAAAAVAICEAVCELQAERREYAAVTVGLAYGPLMIGVVGHKERMTVLTLSETKKFADFLRSIGPKYYSRLIVTSEFAGLSGDMAGTPPGPALRTPPGPALRTPPGPALRTAPAVAPAVAPGAARESRPGNSSGNYNCRFLGFIHVRSPEAVKKVYDIFDGDEVRVRNTKRKTKMVFEKGVVLFTEQRLQEARQYFIEVLKMDRSDKAAREYLLRCDAGMNGQKQEVFLETY